MAIVSAKKPSFRLKYSRSDIMARSRDGSCHFRQRRAGGNEIRNDVEVAASAAAERVMKVERRRDGGRADSIHFVSVARVGCCFVSVGVGLSCLGVRFRLVAGCVLSEKENLKLESAVILKFYLRIHEAWNQNSFSTLNSSYAYFKMNLSFVSNFKNDSRE